MPLELNEWVRFDQPGVYPVNVSSRRATDSLKGPLWSGNGVLVKSNFVELHIIKATPEWQQAKPQI
jgi:hypothetical protein